ncbi:MAG: hypothetical protein K9H64_18755 [Bacteroidales bacterium]|nr:hypothetical protein [Bacteroidales bacterium]MCF8458096.1 hypothetical protein [Bacteroidales bacterium]
MINKPHILLIGGTGRNVGKTTLVCDIINHFSREHKIVGLKITNHFHSDQSNSFNLFEEINPEGTKDSSRMLKAGASKVFYIESEAENLASVFDDFSEEIEPGQIIVCESNGLSELVKPGVYLLVDRDENIEKKPSVQKALQKVDAVVEMKNGGFLHVLSRLTLESNVWQWREQVGK